MRKPAIGDASAECGDPPNAQCPHGLGTGDSGIVFGLQASGLSTEGSPCGTRRSAMQVLSAANRPAPNAQRLTPKPDAQSPLRGYSLRSDAMIGSATIGAWIALIAVLAPAGLGRGRSTSWGRVDGSHSWCCGWSSNLALRALDASAFFPPIVAAARRGARADRVQGRHPPDLRRVSDGSDFRPRAGRHTAGRRPADRGPGGALESRSPRRSSSAAS